MEELLHIYIIKKRMKKNNLKYFIILNMKIKL